ncbi:tRNA-dihydrouridine synthase, partial [Klebsiella pneumoniae]|uniref:tRNA-dihydrouridine synthase n=1 Tax=Klebsiella pneumoniae TaxID=573 RepID=UPI0030138C9A
KHSFPALTVVVNGGLRDAPSVIEALGWCDGVMLGREAYHRPYLLAELQRALRGDEAAPPAREALLERMRRYAERELAAGGRLAPITR